MGNQDQRSAVSAVIGILRRLTRLVQLVPFVYLILYASYLLISWFLPDSILGLLDSIIFVSPATSGGLLALSRILKLCKWHKAAVMIPFSSQIESYIDSFVFTFSELEIIVINAVIGIAVIIFLILANKHFFHDGRKANPVRNARLLQVQG